MQSYMWVLMTAALVALGIYTFLPGWLARRRAVPNPLRRAADGYRQMVATVLSGLAVFATFVWTFTKDRETLQQSADQEANRQYTEAAKMLDEGHISSRAAAVYSLGNLAAIQPSLYAPIRATLVSFLGAEPLLSIDPNKPEEGFGRVDGAAQAAIGVLSQRETNLDNPLWPLSLDGFTLNGASFHHLKGYQGANFSGVKAHGTDFRCAVLDGATFDGADLSDYHAYSGFTNSVTESPTWESSVKYRFIVNFEGASLVGVHFHGASLAGARFVNADLDKAEFGRSNLSRADFAGALHITPAMFRDSEGKSACADVSPRFDESVAIHLPACHAGMPIAQHGFQNMPDGLTFTDHGQTCTARMKSAKP